MNNWHKEKNTREKHISITWLIRFLVSSWLGFWPNALSAAIKSLEFIVSSLFRSKRSNTCLKMELVQLLLQISKELKYFFIWPIFRPQSLTIYNDEMGSFWSNLVRWIEHFSALDSAFPAFWRCKIWKNESTWQRIMPKFPLKVASPPPWRICQGL